MTILIASRLTGCGGGNGEENIASTDPIVDRNISANFNVDKSSSYTLFSQCPLYINRKAIRQTNLGAVTSAISNADLNNDGLDDVFISGRNLSMILRHLPFEFRVLFSCSLAPA